MCNSLGATPPEELYIVYRYVAGRLRELGVEIVMPLVGRYATSMEMTGLSLTFCQLDEELEQWRERALGCFPYIILDARYVSVRHGGSVRSCALLTAIDIDEEGKRAVLGTSVSLSEAEVHWRTFLTSPVPPSST